MDFKIMLTTFWLIFLAELGDKTQLATLCFSADCETTRSRISVFLGSAGALILTSFMAVVLGGVVNKIIPPNYIKIGAGILFVILGLWMIFAPSGK
jgi:putative Ca2+/H+ antiporter (TMEM165/GDT1 family)